MFPRSLASVLPGLSGKGLVCLAPIVKSHPISQLMRSGTVGNRAVLAIALSVQALSELFCVTE